MSAQNVQLHYYDFAVNETTYSMWKAVDDKLNLTFLNNLDPFYFSHIAETHGPLLEGEQKHYAATALRVGYSQGLESLFAFLCATVQAPDCPVGWLLKYKTEDLMNVVRNIQHRKDMLSKLATKPVTWDSLAQTVFIYYNPENPEAKAKVCKGFARVWERFAEEFTDEAFSQEYNSIKHGLRVQFGGFSVNIGLETTPGVPAPPENMRSFGGSEFGSAFSIPEKLDKHNFYLKRQSMNWNPQRFIHGLQLISLSVFNVASFLEVQQGMDPSEINYLSPSEESYYDEPLNHYVTMNSVTRNPGIHSKGLPLRTREQILASYKARADAS